MLEAERAGARALVVYMESFPRNSEGWTLLRRVQADEAHNCALIGKLLEKAGVPYSHATGAFYERAVAIKGARERLGFLVKGLRWAVKRFEAALPTLDADAQAVFARMRDSHLRSIEACERLAGKLSAAEPG
jgi:nitronate monooxygenase